MLVVNNTKKMFIKKRINMGTKENVQPVHYKVNFCSFPYKSCTNCEGSETCNWKEYIYRERTKYKPSLPYNHTTMHFIYFDIDFVYYNIALWVTTTDYSKINGPN